MAVDLDLEDLVLAEADPLHGLALELHAVAQKLGEEAVETALAAVAEPPERLVAEAADLLYHLLVLLRLRELDLGDVVAELERRHRGTLAVDRRD